MIQDIIVWHACRFRTTMDRIYLLIVILGLIGQSYSADPYFWHITDFHLDPTYYTTQDSCNDQIPASDLGKYGDYRCDPPYELIRSSVKAMKEEGNNPEFVLYTGDTPSHPKNYSVFSEDFFYTLHQNATNLINEFFPTAKKVITIGNHDFYPKDQLPGGENPQYERLANLWAPWFDNDPEIIATFKKGAYYTQMLNAEKKLRVVVTNNNLYLTSNKATEGQDDPAGQYAWINQVLTQARADGDNVHLVVHVPPGKMPSSGYPSWLREADNARFNDIVREFSDVIKGYYSCHEHLDSFRMYYKNDTNNMKKPVAVMLVAPSVTPWIARITATLRAVAHNPAVRKIFFSPTSGHLTDVEQYYLDLPKANADLVEPVWKRLYTFRALYGVDDVTPESMHGLVEKFKKYGSSDYHNWYDKRVVEARDSSNGPCDCACKFSSICSMQEVDYADFNRCKSEVTCGVEGLFRFSSVAVMLLSVFVCLFM